MNKVLVDDISDKMKLWDKAVNIDSASTYYNYANGLYVVKF